MFLVKVLIPQAGGLFFRSLEEPRWVKTSAGAKLSFVLPEDEDFSSFTDRPQMPIYRKDLVNVSWREERQDREDPLTAKERIQIEREAQEFEFLKWLSKSDDPPNYSEVRDWLGWGQKRTKDFLLDLSDRGLIQRRREGRSSLFTLTKPGHTRYAELFMAREEE